MSSRWFNVITVLFWLTTMAWLIQQKVMPPLMVGDPPSYRTLVEAKLASRSPVRWKMDLDGQSVGWASSQLVRRDDGVSEIRGRVYFSRLPISQITPAWLGSFLRSLDGGQSEIEERLTLDASSSLEIDPLGRPIGFRSTAIVGDPRDDTEFKISMQGVVEGSQLKLTVTTGDLVYSTKAFLPPDALLADALSPQANLPGLRPGQSWTVPVYSPFRNSPLEILHAQVDRREPMIWDNAWVSTLVVSFRSDRGLDPAHDADARAQAWVASDGRVLKQQIALASSRLTFIREPAKSGEGVRSPSESNDLPMDKNLGRLEQGTVEKSSSGK